MIACTSTLRLSSCLWCCRDNEFDQKTRQSLKHMNYVSAQLMKARDRGTHATYLHRLYAEGLEELENKRRQVRSGMSAAFSTITGCASFLSAAPTAWRC